MLVRLITLAAALLALTACTSSEAGAPTAEPDPTADPEPADAIPSGELIVYSGRSEELVGPLMERFEQETGIDAGVRYGDTAEMAATILEEGPNSPADVFLAQDAGALGVLAESGILSALPEDILDRVEPRFRSPEGGWVGISGRARVVAYHEENVDPADLPDSIFGFTDPQWQGRIGWVPTNGSFQAFVTAMRVLEGEERTRAWLEGIIANDPVVYPNNPAALQGTAIGEVDVAFINHYYLFRALEEEGEGFGADITFLPGGDAGSLVNVAGAGILQTSDNRDAAERLIAFLLSEEAQQYFSEETFEYPLVAGVQPDPRLPSLADLQTPDLDLTNLSDLNGTLLLLQEVGALD